MKDKFNPRDTESKLSGGKARPEAKALEKRSSAPAPKSVPSAPTKPGLPSTNVPSSKLVQLKAPGLAVAKKATKRPGAASSDPKTPLRNKGVKQVVDGAKQAFVEPGIDLRKEIKLDTFASELNLLFESMQGVSAQAAYAAAFAASSSELGKAAVEAKRRGL